jgi:hypothetical protein
MFLFKRPAAPLPKITAPTAADLAAKSKPSPAAQTLVKPNQTPAEYIAALEQNKQSTDAVNALAHGMEERDSVHWACQSSRKVGDKLNAEDTTALQAAESWVKTPSPENQAAAQAAASKTDFTGPGGWAAQAAAWSQNPAPAAAAGAPAAANPTAGLAAPAVAGAVLLAAGLANRPAMAPAKKPVVPQAPGVVTPTVASAPAAAPQLPPVDQNKQSKMLQPFIDLGKDVASGKNSWA